MSLDNSKVISETPRKVIEAAAALVKAVTIKLQ